MSDPLLWIVAAFLVIAGLVGIVLPAVPGTLLVFLGLCVAAAIDGFQKVGWITLAFLAVLTLLAYGIDFVAASLGAKRVGASKGAIIGAALGMLIGLFFGIPGIILGPFLGAIAGEWIVARDLRQAGKAGAGTWLGLILGTAAKLALVFVMIGIFALSYLL